MKQSSPQRKTLKQPPKMEKVSDLILAIFEHPNSLDWLLGSLHDAISDNSYADAFDPDYIKGMLKGTNLDVEVLTNNGI